MKRMIAILLSVIMLLAFASCGAGSESSGEKYGETEELTLTNYERFLDIGVTADASWALSGEPRYILGMRCHAEVEGDYNKYLYEDVVVTIQFNYYDDDGYYDLVFNGDAEPYATETVEISLGSDGIGNGSAYLSKDTLDFYGEDWANESVAKSHTTYDVIAISGKVKQILSE